MLSTLRGQVLLGAILWTLGLLALWATALTFHPHTFRYVAVVHGYPNTLMIGAAVCMAAGLAVVRAGVAPFKEMRRRLADVRAGTTRQLAGQYPAEVEPLVRDLNALLAHHEAAASRAIAKAGDLAHGLKTPLAVLSHDAERAAAAGQRELATPSWSRSSGCAARSSITSPTRARRSRAPCRVLTSSSPNPPAGSRAPCSGCTRIAASPSI